MIHKHKKGFTLLEMIVAVAVFSVAAILGVSSYLALTGAQKKALTLQTIQDNLRFSIESMARDVRTGSFYYCGYSPTNLPLIPSSGPLPWTSATPPWTSLNCPSTGQAGTYLTFVRGTSTVVTYRSGDCGSSHYCIERSEDGGVTFTPITSTDVEIGDATTPGLSFYVIGAPHRDNIPGRVTIYIKGTARSGKELSTFDLQTTVAQFQLSRSSQ